SGRSGAHGRERSCAQSTKREGAPQSPRGGAGVAPGRHRSRRARRAGAAPGPMRRRARGRDRGAHEHRFSLLTACTTPSAAALAADHRAGLALAAVAADLAVAARAGPAPRRPDPLRHRRGVDQRGGRGPHPPPRAHADPHRGAARRDRHGRGLGDPGRRAGRGPRRAVADAARAGHLGRDGRAARPGGAGRADADRAPLRWACDPRGKVLMRIGRRALLAAAAALPLTVLAGCDGFSTTSVTEQEFTETLRIPPLADSTVRDGVRIFRLTAQEGSMTFSGVPGPTTTWGFGGDVLGPPLRAARAEQVAVESAGGTGRPQWRIAQPAATLWYHPHPHGATEEHVYRGLAGLFLLEDDASLAAALPREYGVDDLPLIVQDRSFDGDGALELRHDGAEPGMLGRVVMVNGTVGAVHEVSTERVRLRLLNGSTARTYTFALPDRPMTMVASGGGFLDAPL